MRRGRGDLTLLLRCYGQDTATVVKMKNPATVIGLFIRTSNAIRLLLYGSDTLRTGRTFHGKSGSIPSIASVTFVDGGGHDSRQLFSSACSHYRGARARMLRNSERRAAVTDYSVESEANASY